jgi:hypothetical protein
MDLNLYSQDIKKIFYSWHFSKASAAAHENRRLLPLLTNFGYKSLLLQHRQFESLFFYFSALIFFTLTLATILFLQVFCQRSQK